MSHTTNPKKQHFATTTLKFGFEKFSVIISYVYSHPSGTRHLALSQQDRAAESGNQQLREPATPGTSNQSLRAQQYNIIILQGQPPYISTDCSADSRNRTPRAGASLHMQKESSGKHKK